MTGTQNKAAPLSALAEAIADAYCAWGDPANFLTFNDWVAEHRDVILDSLRHCDSAGEEHIEAHIKRLAPTMKHILYLGVALCRFSEDYAADWPPGYAWVSMAARDDATCEDCKSLAQRAHEEKP
jgi:hypothetical protein